MALKGNPFGLGEGIMGIYFFESQALPVGEKFGPLRIYVGTGIGKDKWGVCCILSGERLYFNPLEF
jgi:hypothetical protein